MARVRLSGLALEVRDDGSGLPALLLHGFPSSNRSGTASSRSCARPGCAASLRTWPVTACRILPARSRAWSARQDGPGVLPAEAPVAFAEEVLRFARTLPS